MRHHLAAGVIGFSALAAAPEPAAAYPIDCAILLCMAGGFPSDPVCTGAYAEVIRRITPWPIEPPLQIWNCPMGASLDTDLGALPEIHEAAFGSTPSGSDASSLVIPVLTPGADVDISGPAFDFVRSMRIYHRHVRQYEDQEEDGDVCRRESQVSVGTYDALGRFEWDDTELADFPPAFMPTGLRGCARGSFGSVFLDWRDGEGTYDFEQVNY